MCALIWANLLGGFKINILYRKFDIFYKKEKLR